MGGRSVQRSESRDGLQNVLNGGGWTALGPENFVLVRDGDNLVQNGGFEKDGSGKLLSTGDGAFTATSLQGWGSLNNKFEYWRHHNDMDAAGGNYFLELDVDQASKSDAVYQELAVKKGKDYRVLVETARRPDAEDEMTNTLRMVLMQYEGPNARDRGSRVIVGPGHKKWAGFSIVARTLSGGDGKAWVGFSEDVGTDDSYGGLLDNVIVRQINESRAVCPSP